MFKVLQQKIIIPYIIQKMEHADQVNFFEICLNLSISKINLTLSKTVLKNSKVKWFLIQILKILILNSVLEHPVKN